MKSDGRSRRASGRVVTGGLPEALPPVEFDYVEIDQVLSNLIENASRHTPATADICISVRLQGEEAEVTVADSGPGVPEDALQRLFTPFHAGPSRDGAPRGSGLGLAIARGLVEAHCGRV